MTEGHVLVKNQHYGEDFLTREFPMSDTDFKTICKIAFKLTGIKLGPHKKNLVYGRLSRHLRRIGCSDFKIYCDMLLRGDCDEKTVFINSITTNLTSFFREPYHFQYLNETLFPFLLKRNNQEKKIRIWSAGCSTGEEPYSIAMLIRSTPEFKHWDIKILATDLDSNVLKTGEKGIYSEEKMDNIEQKYKPFLLKNAQENSITIADTIKSLVHFRQLNLLENWPINGPFDIIFCRNVVIYFDKNTQIKLFSRYAEIMSDDAALFVGHSESLIDVTTRFSLKGQTIYQRTQ